MPTDRSLCRPVRQRAPLIRCTASRARHDDFASLSTDRSRLFSSTAAGRQLRSLGLSELWLAGAGRLPRDVAGAACRCAGLRAVQCGSRPLCGRSERHSGGRSASRRIRCRRFGDARSTHSSCRSDSDGLSTRPCRLSRLSAARTASKLSGSPCGRSRIRRSADSGRAIRPNAADIRVA